VRFAEAVFRRSRGIDDASAVADLDAFGIVTELHQLVGDPRLVPDEGEVDGLGGEGPGARVGDGGDSLAGSLVSSHGVDGESERAARMGGVVHGGVPAKCRDRRTDGEM